MKTAKTKHTPAVLSLLCAALCLAGCGSVEGYIRDKLPGESPAPSPAFPDAVPFSELRWDFGGFSADAGATAEFSITSVSFNGSTLNYSVADAPANWGSEGGAPRATVFAIFFKRANGTWTGGKVDWIGFFGKPRPLADHLAHYENWDESVPIAKGTEYAVVLVRGDSKSRRSSVARGVVK
jgi:hypothetical protein